MITNKRKEEIKEAKRQARAMKVPDDPPAILRADARVTRWKMPDPALYATQMELLRRVPAVQTVDNMLGSLISTAKIQVFNTSGERKQITPHPLEELLRRPNELNSTSEYWRMSSTHRLLTGNLYWWLNKANENSIPYEIWVIPPQNILPIPNEKLYLESYAYDPGDGQVIRLEPWEILHVKRPNPFNSFIGLSPVEAIAVTALGDIEAREWMTRFYGANDGQPSALFAFAEMVNNKDWDRLQKSFKDAGDNKKSIMLRGVGKGGIEWLKSGSVPSDLAFFDGIKLNEETIYNALAPGLASMLAINANVANASVGESIFRNFAGWSMLFEFSSKFNQKNGLMSLYGDDLEADFEDIRFTDKALELQELAAYKETHTIGEVNKKYYNEPLTGDEREDLFVVQMTNAAGIEEDETEQNQTTEDSILDDIQSQIEPEEQEQEEPVKSAYEIDLDKWKRKAAKRFPDSAPFTSDHIPHAVKVDILERLEECQDKEGVRAVFDSALDSEPNRDTSSSGLEALLDVAIKAMNEEKPEQPATNIINLTVPATPDMTPTEMAAAFTKALGEVPPANINVVNEVKPADAIVQAGDVTVNVPDQEAPQVQVDVNLKSPEHMTTLHKRNDEGEIFRSDTEIE